MPPMAEMGRPDALHDFIGAERGEHVQRDRLHRRSRVAAMPAFAADIGSDFERIQIDAHDRVQRIDQRKRARAAGNGRARGTDDIGDVGRELDDHGNARHLHHPARDLLAVFGNLADGAAHAALAHAVRAAIVQLDAVGAGIFDAGGRCRARLRASIRPWRKRSRRDPARRA